MNLIYDLVRPRRDPTADLTDLTARLAALEQRASDGFVLTAEEGSDVSAGRAGGWQWSFGNGATLDSGTGIVLLRRCNLIGVTLSVKGVSNNTVAATKNGAVTSATVSTVQAKTGRLDLAVPLEYAAGDIFNFRTTVGSARSNGGRIAAWFETL